jgi:hypothetical protein
MKLKPSNHRFQRACPYLALPHAPTGIEECAGHGLEASS